MVDRTVHAITADGGVNRDADRADVMGGAQLPRAFAGAVAISSQKRHVRAVFGELLGGGEPYPGGAADENEVAPRDTQVHAQAPFVRANRQRPILNKRTIFVEMITDRAFDAANPRHG